MELHPLESLWPPYRGSVLLGAARESQGRIRNAGIAVTAGHVAISLDVHPDRSAAATSPTAAGSLSSSKGTHRRGDEAPFPEVAAAGADGAMFSPSLRLTVLLDAVPASAPKPGTQQLARFLTKVLGRSASGYMVRDDQGGSGLARREGGLLGADVPEMLVVEHKDEVVCSEFLRFDHRHTKPGTTAAESAGGGGSSNRSGLAYACIEAGGVLRLWEWRGTESSGWTWRFLSSCNICACREEPVGCRVLTAAIVPEPRDSDGGGSKRRHRLVWEQEDSGEGPGLGLASTPAAGPRPPRRVWSRRITFDLSEGGLAGDGYGFANQQQQHQNLQYNGGGGFGNGDATGTGGTRSEISLAFSACLLPTGVDALLCSRLGAWMPTGQRVYFNHFATGRLPCVTLPSLLPRGRGAEEVAASATAESADGTYDGAAGVGDGDAFPDESGLEIEGALDSGDEDAAATAAAEQAQAFATEPNDGRGSAGRASARRLFSVHDATGDLMVYDHHPRATVCVLSLLSGAGGLGVRLQCTLDPPPPPASSPGSFAARSHVAILCGGGLCSAYDLCTGLLIGSAAIPRCPACFRRRHRSRAASVATPCTCGRRRPQGSVASEPRGDKGADVPAAAAAATAASGPGVWTSETRGHLSGIWTATQVLRVRVPRAEACLTATLTPSLRGGELPPPSAPSALRYVREYRRLVVGATGGAWPASPLPELLRAARQGRAGTVAGNDGEARTGSPMMDLIGHALSAEERGRSVVAPVAGGAGLNTANGSGRKDPPVPPWLLMAMVSASQNQGPAGAPEAGGTGVPLPLGFGGGDPATAAPEAGLRDALERRVEESLRSLNSVRDLLQDPAGSARPGAADGAEGASRSGGDDEAAIRLAALTAGVDPATALFEGTLREWLACRRRGKGNGEWSSRRPREGSGLGGGVRGSAFGRGSRTVPDDALALAFRCESAGDAEAMEIPFLHFLLEASGEADPGREENNNDGKTPPVPSSSAYSTFLCLQLAGDDGSPLFEVACRALFRLQPQKLPRFAERLARFRAYADEIVKQEGWDAGAGGAPRGSSGDADEGEAEEEEAHGRRGASIPSADARSERTPGEDTAFAEEQQQQQRSPSPPSQSGVTSRRTSEGNASEHGERDGRATTRPSSTVTSREYSPEQPALPPAPAAAAAAAADDDDDDDDPSPSGAADNMPDPATGPPSAARERPGGRSQENAPTARAYFARALASLPPAVDDDRVAGSGFPQRRARLSLLLGAGRFAEACKLLRSRAWAGSGLSPDGKRGSWRGDRGGEEAWRAAMRLLNELRRAVADKGEDVAAAGAGVPQSFQFRLAFEDALAETILADSPERMEAVMLCRPEGLTPVAVVRMVRRAAAVTAAAGAAGAGAEAEAAGQQALSGSTQTLKLCLLLLLEDDTKQEAAAA